MADGPLMVEDGTGLGPAKGTSLSSLLRFKWTLLAVFVLVAVPAITLNWALRVPQYEARGEVRVRMIIPYAVDPRGSGVRPLPETFLKTQAKILQSPTVLQRVLDQQDIQQTKWYKHPRKPLLGQLGTHVERLGDALSVETQRGNEIIDVVVVDRGPNDAAALVNAVMDQFIRLQFETANKDDDGIIAQLTQLLKSLETEIAGREKVLAELRKGLGTGDPDKLVAQKRVRLDEIEARLDNLTAEISVLQLHRTILVEAIISRQQMERLRYIRGVSGMSESAKRQLRTQLREQRDALEAQIAEAKEALTRLGKRPVAQDPDKQDPKTKIEVDEATARIKILERELAAVQWREKEMAKLMSRSANKKKVPTSQPLVRRAYSTDQEWRRLEAAVRSARFKVERMKKRVKDSHPAMVEAVNQLQLAEKQLETREMQLAQQWQEGPGSVLVGTEDIDRTQDKKTTERDYEDELKSVELQLVLLKHQATDLLARAKKERTEFEAVFNTAEILTKETRDLDHKRTKFEKVRARLDQEEMKRNMPGSVEILSRALVPSRPARDRRLTDTIVIVVIAFGMGIGAAFVRANRTQAMHGAEDLPSPLRAPFLGQVPLIRKAERLAVEEDPLVAESIRMVRTALFLRTDGQCSAVLVSSADTGAGKSTVATMLARSFADCGKRVLLIDADLRRRGLSRRFGLADGPGFVQSLTRKAADDQTIFKTDTPRLSIMPAGTRGDGIEIEMTANGALTACLDRLRPKYDVILLDSSPILPVADARILAGQVDGTVMVIREDMCRREEVVDALAHLSSSGGKLLGTIFIGSVRRSYYQPAYYGRAEK